MRFNLRFFLCGVPAKMTKTMQSFRKSFKPAKRRVQVTRRTSKHMYFFPSNLYDSHSPMSRRAYEPNRLYRDLPDDGTRASSSSSSKRPSRWDQSSERRDERHVDRHRSRIEKVDEREIDRSRYKDEHHNSNGSRHERERQDYKDRRERDRKRSHSPSSSGQFTNDRERERRAYDRQYGTGDKEDKNESDPSTNNHSVQSNPEPDFGSSGLLAKESNQKNGTQLKYFEPPEARKPKKKWRLYVFKDGKEIDMFHISRQSCYLFGRDQNVVDIHVEHPSISKQHCVIQFRNLTERNEFGDEKRQIKPFLIDLDSANGSIVNKTEIPASRYYELRNGDTIKLGASQREYVLLAEDQ